MKYVSFLSSHQKKLPPRFSIMLLLSCVLMPVLFAQTPPSESPSDAPSEFANSQSPKSETIPLPRSFRDITLGTDYSTAYEQIEADPLLLLDPKDSFQEFEEVQPMSFSASFLPFIPRIQFSFQKESLVMISLYFDKEVVGFEDLYRALKKKYGSANYIRAQYRYWEDEKTRISVENPAIVKYISKEVLTPTQDSSQPQNIENSPRNPALDQRLEGLQNAQQNLLNSILEGL